MNKKIESLKSKKGSIKNIAIIAGIMGAKETSKLIPLCHNIPIDAVNIEIIKNIKKHSRVVKKKSKIALVANRGRDYTNIYWELDEFLEGQKIPFLTMVRDSQNYIRGAEKGLGIYEMGPAMTEVDRTYFDPIIDWLNSKRSR